MEEELSQIDISNNPLPSETITQNSFFQNLNPPDTPESALSNFSFEGQNYFENNVVE
jgi:hypothetical protein